MRNFSIKTSDVREGLSYVRGATLILFGIFTLFFINGPFHYFTQIASLQVISFIPLWVIGLIAVIIGTLLFFKKTLIAGYLSGSIFLGILALSAIISIFSTPPPHSPTSFLFIITSTAFIAGTYYAVGDKYGYTETSPVDKTQNIV